MEVKCIRVLLKDDSVALVREWFKELNSRKNEVLETLEQEQILVESAFLDFLDNKYYLIYYIKSQNISKALEVFKNSKLPIDCFYKDNWNNFCTQSITLEPLLDVDLLHNI